MQPAGSDRLRVTDDGKVMLLCRESKGWLPRSPRTSTSAEHPGTAVLCDDEYYEVVSATVQDGGAIRYVLEKWRDEHAIRVADRYDNESERLRTEARASDRARETRRKGTLLAGVFAGHLPAIVQERIGSELGVLPIRLTAASMLLPFAFVAWVVWDFAGRTITEGSSPTPFPLLVLAVYLGVELGIRMVVMLSQSQPIGSSFGFLAYLLAWLFGPRHRMLSPFAAPSGTSVRITTAPEPEQALTDELMLKEPFATLLSVSEQRALEARFGYDYRRQSRMMAVRLLIIGAIGTVTSIVTLRHTPRLSAVVALIVAALIAAEQLIRLAKLRSGPAPSLLAPVARRLLARLLARAASR